MVLALCFEDFFKKNCCKIINGEIGFQHAKKKQRVRVVEFWIETARECFNIGNFNSLMAIIAGLNMSPLSRLKKTVSPLLFGYVNLLDVGNKLTDFNSMILDLEMGKLLFNLS